LYTLTLEENFITFFKKICKKVEYSVDKNHVEFKKRCLAPSHVGQYVWNTPWLVCRLCLENGYQRLP